MLERPITTASNPASDECTVFASRMQAERRAWRQRRQAGGEPPGVDRMKAIDVLGRIIASEHLLGVDLLRQRQLHQDAVHRRIGIELVHQRHQFGLAHAVRQAMVERRHAGLFRGLALLPT